MQKTADHETKSFVNDNDSAIIVCPACSAAKNVSVAQFRTANHIIKVNCKCGNSFKVLLDFRQSYRKPTNLAGSYAMLPPASGGGPMQVKNVSLNGIGFEVQGRHTILIGQKAVVKFTLDNRKETLVKKQAIVRSVRGNFIGCEFQQEQAFDKDLGFYLRF